MILIYRTWILVLLLVFSVVVFYQRALREEAALAARFGNEWQAYAARSKFLIPFYLLIGTELICILGYN